jgi:prepilin-type N-terminal cleavage/methylation domain-containing protein
MKNESGFTLMELVVVVALIATISLITMPRFQHLLGPDIEQDAQMQLENLLFAIRQESVLARSPLVVLYDLKEGSFRSGLLSEDDQPGTEGDTLSLKRRLPEGIAFMDIDTPQDGKVTEGTCYTIVWPTGWIEPTTLHIKDSQDKPYTMFIEPIAGTVRLEEGYLERRRITS